MSKDFENLPEISELLVDCIWMFDEQLNQYLCDDLDVEVRLNSALYAYNEQQKIIDEQNQRLLKIKEVISHWKGYRKDLKYGGNFMLDQLLKIEDLV